MFSSTTAVLGCQVSVLSFFLLPVICVVSAFVISDLIEFFLFRMRRRARDAPAAEVADNVEQSFQDEALIPAPQHRGRDSSGRGVLFQVVFAYV